MCEITVSSAEITFSMLHIQLAEIKRCHQQQQASIVPETDRRGLTKVIDFFSFRVSTFVLIDSIGKLGSRFRMP